MGVLEVVGLIVCGYAGINLLIYLSKFVRPAVNVKRLGDWALVTGATDGIGKAFANELAKRGLNIILVSRTLSKLQEVAEEIESKHKVKTAVIAIDFSEPDQVFNKIKEGIQDIDGSIGLLVNNVGMGYDHPEYFLEIEDCGTMTKNMVSLNVSSVLNVTRAVLPAMVNRKKGAVINISSASSLQSTPLLSVYSSTKAFVNRFSQDLQVEYRGKGITIQAFAPFYVVSKLSKFKRPTFFVPSAETYAKSALSTLGLNTISTGYFPHDIVLFGIKVLTLLGIQGTFVYKELSGIRARALKKKAKNN